MPMNVDTLAGQVTSAFTSQLLPGMTTVAQQFAEHLRSLARIAVAIEAQRATGSITEAEAQLMLDNQKLVLAIVAFGATGQAKVALERSINAALDVVVGAINAATGFQIIRPT